MGNCINTSKYNKISVNSIYNQDLIEVTFKYKNGIKQKLSYPQSQEWIKTINKFIITGHIHGDTFPPFEWTYSK